MPSCEKSGEKKAAVDFKNRIPTEENRKLAEVQPLQIAIAAVVSPRETVGYYGDMVKYLGKKLDRPIEIVQRKTYQEINDMLERNELDIAFVCSASYVSGHKKFGMELLVAPVLVGKPYYQAYFIVHKKKNINGMQDLKGKRFAFTDPNSNTGTLVPIYVLSKMGETPEKFFKEFIFTYSHDNSIKAVAKELVDGASVDGLVWDYYNERNPVFVKDTKIIYKSPYYGMPPVVVHPQASVILKENMKKVFLEMHEDPEGKGILSDIGIEKFIVPEDSAYDSVRQMQQWLEKRK